MLLVITAGIGTLGLMPTPALRAAVAWCVAVNVCFAYWWSGMAKLKVPAWRGGRQVALAVNSPRYGIRSVAWQFLDHAWLGRVTGWSVIGIEVSCPLFLLVGGWPLVAWAVCAVGMHVSVAALMGLGRFTWSFGAGLVCLLAIRLGV